MSHATVGRVYQDWQRGRARAEAATSTSNATVKTEIFEEAAAFTIDGQLALPMVTATNDADLGNAPVTPEEFDASDEVPMTAQSVRGGQMVQHVGAWILVALVGEMGMHEEAQRGFESRNLDGLRIALDAVICALAIGHMCIERVRRIATPTGATLLRAERVPTAGGVRRVLGRLVAQPMAVPCLPRGWPND